MRKIALMTGAKPKPDSTKVRWANQVVKTADGRLLVRGVDVPASGWATVASGKTSKVAGSVLSQRTTSAVPTPITTKREALATAKRAGLASEVLSTSAKKTGQTGHAGTKSLASAALSAHKKK